MAVRNTGNPPVTEQAEGVRLTAPHREGCWGHEVGGFICTDGTEWRTVTGNRKTPYLSGREWHRFKCNDPGCSSIALVRIDVLADLVNGAVDGL